MVSAAIRRSFRENGVKSGRMVAAVSGGTDSTALLLALAELRDDGFDVIAGHVNHHLRGDESDGDEQFVRGLCASLGVPLVVADGTLPPDLVRAHGVEAAAREVRTRCLTAIREECGALLIATAHQKNDQAETVLMRLFTGSGLAGLRGIHAVRDDGCIRPLLDVTRTEIEEFLRERNVTPRIDRMNDDPRFLRTRLRRMLRDVEPFVIENLAGVARQAQEMWPIVERALDSIEDVVVTDDATVFRSLPDDMSLRTALLHRHIRRLDAHSRNVSAEDLARLAREMDGGKRISVTKSLELVARGDEVVLRGRVRPAPPFELKVTAPCDIEMGDATLRLFPLASNLELQSPELQVRGSRFEGRGKNFQQVFTLPNNSSPTFTLRNRRPGDRFHPLGAPGSRKLKDFLIDRRIPQEERDGIPLLIWNGEIVWVAGVEVSERFKVTPGAGEVWSATIDYVSP